MKYLKLTFVNVGYGEAILLECPDARFRNGTFVMVIDGGSAEAEEFQDRSSGRIPLADFLEQRGVDHIDCMVATHIHEDHICGLLAAAERLPPGALWQTMPVYAYKKMHPLDVSAARSPSQDKFLRALNDYQKLCGLVESHGGKLCAMEAKESGALCDGLTYCVLAPTAEQGGWLEARCRELFREEDESAFLQRLSSLDARMNNFSLILRLEYHGTRILLPGDTNCLGYGDLGEKELRARLFKVGHHGQKDGATAELLSAIRPEAVVCCASSDRRYESAHPQVLQMMADSGAELYFSDCPQIPGMTDGLVPHQALEFTVSPEGELRAAYLSE